MYAERKRTGTKKKSADQKTMTTELKSLKKKLGKNKRTIAALQKKVEQDDPSDDSNSGGNGGEDAEDAFGGKRTKKEKIGSVYGNAG